MIEQYGIYIFAVLMIAIFVMSFFIAKLYVRLKQIEKKKSEYRDLQISKYKEVQESLRIISLGVVQEQCEVGEGCIRLRMLLKRYDIVDKNDPELAIIFDLFDKIQDFKYLDARKKLTKQQQFAEDQKRWKIEEEFKDQFTDACKYLLTQLEAVKIS